MKLKSMLFSTLVTVRQNQSHIKNSVMEFSAKIVNGSKLLTISTKCSILVAGVVLNTPLKPLQQNMYSPITFRLSFISLTDKYDRYSVYNSRPTFTHVGCTNRLMLDGNKCQEIFIHCIFNVVILKCSLFCIFFLHCLLNRKLKKSHPNAM